MRGMFKGQQRFWLYPAPVSDQHPNGAIKLSQILLHALPIDLQRNQKTQGGYQHD
jgi:hypothetical protein